jgi:hypothetical protein
MTAPEEGVIALLLSALASAFAALLAFATVCSEQHACIEAGTCYAVSNSSYSCAFKTSITPAGWRMLNTSDQVASLHAMTRGVCAPGLRQSVDPFTGDVQCVRRRNYPSAVSMEIADRDASLNASEDATDANTAEHRRWCGRWIDARRIDIGQEQWAFYDEEQVAWDVEDIILAKGSARLGGSDVAKFRAACRAMVASNAAGPAGRLAFDYLTALVAPAGDSLDSALGGLGVLASHSCDGPVALGLGLGTDGRGFSVTVGTGVEVHGEALREALYAVGAERDERDAAAAFAEEMASVPLAEAVAMSISSDQARVVHFGALAGTWVAPIVTSTSSDGQSHSMRYDVVNAPLARFMHAFADVHAEAGGPANARAYLRGLGAYCAFASGSVVSHEIGALASVSGTAARLRAQRRSAPASASALGRLRSEPSERLQRPIDAADLYAASTITWSQLSAVELSSATRPSARSSCLRAARVAFPEAFDALVYNALVTKQLYDALEKSVPTIRNAAKAALEKKPMSDFYTSSAMRSRAIGVLEGTRLRIAGAPRGSWAGATREFVRPEFTSDDGALLMLLKQARAVYLDRIQRVVYGDSLCEHPPLYDALERNAYMLMWEDTGCSMILPGLLVAPFADERYDQASLYGRIGFVVAHEFMHATAINKDVWNMSHVRHVLRDYRGDHYTEAIADVGAMAALERTTALTNRELCAHVSQLFCARVGWIDAGSTAVSGTHPGGNQRGDAACRFLKTHFS